jgi:chemotaxis signal transduction protein
MMVVMSEAGLQRIACPVSDVLEVVGRPQIQPLPGMPAWVEGLFTYRGQLTLCVNLGSLLDGAATERELSRRLMIVQIPDAARRCVALNVDRMRIETLTETLDAALERSTLRGPVGKLASDPEGIVCLLSPALLYEQLAPHLAALSL